MNRKTVIICVVFIGVALSFLLWIGKENKKMYDAQPIEETFFNVRGFERNADTDWVIFSNNYENDNKHTVIAHHTTNIFEVIPSNMRAVHYHINGKQRSTMTFNQQTWEEFQKILLTSKSVGRCYQDIPGQSCEVYVIGSHN